MENVYFAIKVVTFALIINVNVSRDENLMKINVKKNLKKKKMMVNNKKKINKITKRMRKVMEKKFKMMENN